MKKIICLDCPNAIWSASKRCKSCAAKAKYADPAARMKMRQAKLRSLAARPEQLAKLRADGAAQLRILHAKCKAKGYRHTFVGQCPPERRGDYEILRKKVGAAEALRIIREDEAARTRPAIRQTEQQMREREERRQREAY